MAGLDLHKYSFAGSDDQLATKFAEIISMPIREQCELFSQIARYHQITNILTTLQEKAIANANAVRFQRKEKYRRVPAEDDDDTEDVPDFIDTTDIPILPTLKRIKKVRSGESLSVYEHVRRRKTCGCGDCQ